MYWELWIVRKLQTADCELLHISGHAERGYSGVVKRTLGPYPTVVRPSELLV